MKGQRPNIVFLLLDTVRADYLRAYGGNVRMPFLEHLARKGVLYERAIAPSTYTAPSHASLFLNKRTLGIKAFRESPLKNLDEKIDPFVEKVKYIPRREITLAAKLNYLGYSTAVFSNNPFLSQGTGLTNGFEHVKNLWIEEKLKKSMLSSFELRLVANKTLRNMLIKLPYAISLLLTKKHLDAVYLDLKRKLDKHFAIRYGFYKLDAGAKKTNKAIEDYARNAGSASKFIFVNYMEGHEGYPTNLITKRYVDQEKWLYLAGLIDGKDIGIIKEAYARRLGYLDDQISRLFGTLKETGILDNAVVIIASDHGQAFMEHGLMYHNMFPFEELVHVPLISARFINGKQVTSGEVVSKPVSLTALHESILNIANGTADEVNGKLRRDNFVISDHVGITEFWDLKFLKLLRRRSSYADKIYRTKLFLNKFATAVYYRNFKLIVYKDKKAEMYDLKEDPEEKVNIISSYRGLALKMANAAKAI